MLARVLGTPAKSLERPVARALSVGHRLQRREGLRGDDEKRFRRIEIARRLHEIGAIDVGNEAESHGAVAVMLQRLVRHHGPEVGAADADVDDVAYALARMTLPLATAHTLGEVGHLVEHGMNLGHDVLAVYDYRNADGPSIINCVSVNVISLFYYCYAAVICACLTHFSRNTRAICSCVTKPRRRPPVARWRVVWNWR